jgi:LPS-assembly protein
MRRLLAGLVLAVTRLGANDDPQEVRQTLTIRPADPPPIAKPIPPGEWEITAERQVVDGKEYRLFGGAIVEDSRMVFRADEIEFDRESGDLHARGHVYFYSFERRETIRASRVDYNTQTKAGKFYDPVGEFQPSITVRRGVLTSSNPFHFEGEWAERLGDRYVLYNGWITNCRLPNPWWLLRGPKFDIVSKDRAIAHRSTFVLNKVPVFYTPFFYHSLAEEPRKSGFLLPNIGHSTRRGMMVGLGYYWAINRSTDATYRVQNFTARGFTHHVDFRTKPTSRTDFGAVLYGVQDRGVPDSGDPPRKYSGVSLYAVGRSDLANGWKAQGSINYITSFRFRQEWTDSFNEAIGTEISSVGFVNKTWRNYSFDGVLARLENFLSSEIAVVDPGTAETRYLTNAVTIRKLPEAQFSGADARIWKRLPLWFSFRSAAGLLYRAAPVFEGGVLTDTFQTGRFMNRLNFAPHLMTAIHLGDFHLVPGMGLRETYYGEGQSREADRYRLTGTNLVRSARDFTLDVVFPTLWRVFEKKTVFGDKLKHVIEPRATYRYVTGVGKDFERFIRFDDTDLLTDTNEVEISLTNRIFAKRGDAVDEIFLWQLGQKRFFDQTFGGALVEGRRNVFETSANFAAYSFLLGPRSASPVTSMMRISPIAGLGVVWQSDFDPRTRGIVDSAFTVDYRWREYTVSAGHNQVRTNPLLTPSANQFRYQVQLGDANRRGWNVGASSVYDHKKKVIYHSTGQVTYNTDCCGMSVQFRRVNAGIRESKNEWRMAFSVANIGSFGTLRKQDRIF